MLERRPASFALRSLGYKADIRSVTVQVLWFDRCEAIAGGAS
jgi:hypothetical protein